MRVKQLKIFSLACLVVYFLAGCSGADDMRFARRVMSLLVKGVYSAADMIDWPSFKALERGIGPEFQRLPNDAEKANYQKAFIEGFRLAFQDKGCRMSNFKNWQLYREAGADDISIVSTSTVDKSFALLFFIKHEKGRRKLTEIKMVRVFDEKLFYSKRQG